MEWFELLNGWLVNAAINLHLIRIARFLFFVLISLILGRYTLTFIRAIINRLFPPQVVKVCEQLFQPLTQPIRITGTLVLISLSLTGLREYPSLYNFLRFFSDLAVTISVAWLASRILRQVLRFYGIELIGKLGREVDDLLLVVETIANVIIGAIAVLAFAQGRFDLIGLVASLGIGGIAVAFAAQKILEQLLSTIVLYLDPPFKPGDYIRLSTGQLGRVESIGIRATKIRTLAKSTLIIVPNSTLITMEIENVTSAKKVMVLLYLDFSKILEEREQALVQQAVKESTDALFGIDPGSTNIVLNESSQGSTTRARVTFFILGSNENSLQLRKRLLELANEKISKKLKEFGIEFIVQEPSIYVESPVTI